MRHVCAPLPPEAAKNALSQNVCPYRYYVPWLTGQKFMRLGSTHLFWSPCVWSALVWSPLVWGPVIKGALYTGFLAQGQMFLDLGDLGQRPGMARDEQVPWEHRIVFKAVKSPQPCNHQPAWLQHSQRRYSKGPKRPHKHKDLTFGFQGPI